MPGLSLWAVGQPQAFGKPGAPAQLVHNINRLPIFTQGYMPLMQRYSATKSTSQLSEDVGMAARIASSDSSVILKRVTCPLRALRSAWNE